MESFEGKLAVVTGGGTGMGRELVLQLLDAGCAVATCDVILDNLEETARLAAERSPGVKLSRPIAATWRRRPTWSASVTRCSSSTPPTTSTCSSTTPASAVGAASCWATGRSGIAPSTSAGAASTTAAAAFVPLLVAAPEGHVINTSSVNGFWASLGPGMPHTAYSAAKFAVKGFSEALIEDFRLNAPHVGVSVVMPGHIGTEIVNNSRKILQSDEGPRTDTLANVRLQMERRGFPTDAMDDDAIVSLMESMGAMFRDGAPMTAARRPR